MNQAIEKTVDKQFRVMHYFTNRIKAFNQLTFITVFLH